MGEREMKAVHKIANRQSGIVTIQQCHESGCSSFLVGQRLRSNEWTRIARGIFKVYSGPLSIQQRETAGLLAAGSEAALSHFSAAARLKLDVPKQSLVHVSLPNGLSPPVVKGVRFYRTRDLSADHVTLCDGLPITRIGKTVLDLAALLDADWRRACLDSALRNSPDNLRRIKEALERCGRGKPGAKELRLLLEECSATAEVPDSALESLAVELTMLATGVRPRLHHRLYVDGECVAEIDLAWPEIQFGIELDGWAFHGNTEAFRRDRRRDRRTEMLNWNVKRFVWADILRSRDASIAEIGQLYRRREREFRALGEALQAPGSGVYT